MIFALKICVICGLIIQGFVLKAAQVLHYAFGTIGFTGFTGVAPMENQPVVSILQVFFRYGLEKFQFHLERRFSLRHAGSVCDPEDVRVYRYGRFTKGRIKYNIGRLSSDARQLDKVFDIGRSSSIRQVLMMLEAFELYRPMVRM